MAAWLSKEKAELFSFSFVLVNASRIHSLRDEILGTRPFSLAVNISDRGLSGQSKTSSWDSTSHPLSLVMYSDMLDLSRTIAGFPRVIPAATSSLKFIVEPTSTTQ